MHSATIKHFKTLSLSNQNSQEGASQSQGWANAPPCPPERNPANVGCVPLKTAYCNKTIISSKLFNVKCYFTYIIIILQLTTHNYVHFILGYVVRRLAT